MSNDARRNLQWSELDTVGNHMLCGLSGRRVGPFVIRLYGGPRSRFGAAYFRLHLEDRSTQRCGDAALLGLCSRGIQPSQNWIEIAATAFVAEFPGRRYSLDPDSSPAGHQLWQALGEAIPPGGHIMVEYESPEWRETADALGHSVPPAATSLGYLMFRIGCGVNFKDWYYSEGLHEGPRKLQGWKALNEAHAFKRAAEMADDLAAFLVRTSGRQASTITRARERAEAVLQQLRLTAVLPREAQGRL